MTPTVADLEAAAYATLSPDEQVEVHGWTLRATDGFTRRVNSATAVGRPDTTPAARDAVFGWLGARGIAPTIRVTPLMDEGSVDECLRTWGLEEVDETVVCTAPTSGADTEVVEYVGLDDDRFTDEMLFLNGRNGSGRDAWIRIAQRMGERGTGLWIPGRAVGVAGLSGSIAFVYSVAVHPSHQRRGLGSHIMQAADFWATQRGARHLAIQVVGRNTAGLALYGALGFTETYRYHYLRPYPGGG